MLPERENHIAAVRIVENALYGRMDTAEATQCSLTLRFEQMKLGELR
jgi:hypothetical protein